MVGQTLGHYKILDKLGAGGMGEVYLAEDTTLDREVALKILPPELAESQERLDRFQREAKTLAALDHPNIVTVFTVEQDKDVHFLTMQLVEGKPLSHLITKGGLPLERIFEIAIPLADALATAHEKGVIHRDLKPANIMVTDEGRVKVLDFGLAKLREEAKAPLSTELPTEPLTEEGRILGTMPYMSPEQLEGTGIDSRSDIFSLGVVLYEMASGERPFKGDSSVSLIMSIGRDTPPDVSSMRKELPHHLGRVIRRCLEKNPERRFQSAKDVRNELEDLDKEETSQSASLPSPQPQAPRTRRRWIAAAVGIALLLLGLAVGWALLRGRSQSGSNEISDPEARLLFEQATEYRLRGSHQSTLELAEQNFRSALEIEPDNPLLQGELAYLLSRMQAVGDPAQGREEEASSLAGEALRSDPEAVAAWWARSILFRLEEDHEAAVEAATTAMQIDTEKIRSYLCLGWALIGHGEVDEGLEYLRKGIEREGGAVTARAAYATALLKLGRIDEAIIENKKVLELAPGSGQALNNLGVSYLISGRYLASIPPFRRLLELYPDADAASNLGTSYYYLDRMDEAIEAYLQANKLRRGDYLFEYNLGDAYAKVGDVETSREWYSKAVASSEQWLVDGAPPVSVLCTKWLLLAKLERHQEALDGIRHLEEEHRSNVKVLFTAAQIHALAGQRQEALNYSWQAIEQGFPREVFGHSPEFANFQQDPDFLALLESEVEPR